MRAGEAWIDAQRTPGAIQRCVQFKPVVVDDRLVVQTQRIGRRQCRSLARRIKCLVQSPQRAVHLADIAQIKWRIDAVLERTLHQIERLRSVALPKRQDAGEMQRVPLVRRRTQDMIEQSLRIVRPPGALVFAGDAQDLVDRQRHAARRGQPVRERGILHQSTV